MFALIIVTYCLTLTAAPCSPFAVAPPPACTRLRYYTRSRQRRRALFYVYKVYGSAARGGWAAGQRLFSLDNWGAQGLQRRTLAARVLVHQVHALPRRFLSQVQCSSNVFQVFRHVCSQRFKRMSGQPATYRYNPTHSAQQCQPCPCPTCTSSSQGAWGGKRRVGHWGVHATVL